MTKLKLGPLADDRPVKLSVELPAAVHRDLVACSADAVHQLNVICLISTFVSRAVTRYSGDFPSNLRTDFSKA